MHFPVFQNKQTEKNPKTLLTHVLLMNDGKIKSHTQKKLTSLQPEKSKKNNNNLELTMVKFRLSKNKIHTCQKIHIFHLLTVIQSVRVKRF